ncbi:hypothetical protein PIB30_011533 [Stylosanthes scabra]|uniref:PB1-like domain-containing protein n=1 Tax=Stylosanthes scabra TaxID=79078 RepID=A0ABU6T5R8_9FABA|nr:hypothetical protein [Stylosanthes scabra]
MIYFDIALYHRGYFGYVDGVMRYVEGEKLMIEDNDSDFWSVYEVDKQVRRLGDDDFAALWYKDPSIHNMSIGLRMFLNGKDALAMVRISQLRGHVELFVGHDEYPEEEFPEIGYIDVRCGPAGEDEADPPNGQNEANIQNEEVVGEDAVPNGGNGEVRVANGEGGAANENEEVVGEDAAPIGEKEVNEEVGPNVEEAAANEEGEASKANVVENEEVDGDGDEDSDDAEYVPSCQDADSVDDIQFTDMNYGYFFEHYICNM